MRKLILLHSIPIPLYNGLAAEKLHYQTKEINKMKEMHRILESDSHFWFEYFSYLWLLKMNKTFALSNIKALEANGFEFALQRFWKN